MQVRVTITRYISDDPQPGIVELQLVDAHGRVWVFVEKTVVPCAEDLSSSSIYPKLGTIECVVIDRMGDASGREIVRIDTDRPWGVESVDGVSQFEVLPESLVEEEDEGSY